MEKSFVKNLAKLLVLGSTLSLSACVTQKFENDTPVVKNQANLDEMAVTRISLGLGYLNMGNMEQAKLNLEKAKRFSPQLVQVHTAFAHYYETVGESELTEQSYQQALSIKSDDADTLNNYGVFLCRQKQVEKAEVQFLKAIAVPSYILVSQSYDNLASCFLREDNFEKAETYLEKAIDHSPNRSAILIKMVRLQYAKGDYQRAKYFQRKFEKSTRRFTPDSLALAYKLNMQLGERRIAKNYGAMLVKMYPQSWEAKQYLLNELEQIEADILAERYRVAMLKSRGTLSSKVNKKRVVKLSPNKKLSPNSQRVQSQPALRESQLTAPSSQQNEEQPQREVADKSANLTHSADAMVAEKSSMSNQDDVSVFSEQSTQNKHADSEQNSVVETLSAQTSESKETLYQQSADNAPTPLSQKNSPQSTQNTKQVPTEVTTTVASNGILITYEPITQDSNSDSDDDIQVKTSEVMSLETGKKQDIDMPAPSLTEESLTEESLAEATYTTPTPAQRDDPLPDYVEALTDAEKEILAKEAMLEKVLSDSAKLSEAFEQQADAEKGLNETAVESSSLSADNSENKTLATQSAHYHEVSAGETLFAISVKYNVKITALRQWNGISPNNKLRIGDKLYVVDPKTVTNIHE